MHNEIIVYLVGEANLFIVRPIFDCLTIINVREVRYIIISKNEKIINLLSFKKELGKGQF